MAWAIFTKPYDHDHRPEASFCQHYKVGDAPVNVTRAVLTAAKKAGCAIEARTEKHGDEPDNGA